MKIFLIDCLLFFILLTGCTPVPNESYHNKLYQNKLETKKKPAFPEIIRDQGETKKTTKNIPKAIFDDILQLCDKSQELRQKGDLEQALELLDKAYALVVSLDAQKFPETIKQREDLRFLISKRIMEIYASRMTTTKGNGNAIPIIINQYVQTEIDLFTKGGLRNFFIEAYKRSGAYRPQILKMLEKANLPEELSWLPLIESGSKVKALSPSKALGLWQFIPTTGYKFSLKSDAYIDGRMDPIKATEAAISYLKELYQIFGDWNIALAGYNCGEGKVLRLIREQDINYLGDFWDLYEKLPAETARYIPEFLAVLHIVKNLSYYGLDKIIINEPIPYETVNINKHTSLKSVASTIGESEEIFKALNPELRYGLIPPYNYTLKTPSGKGDLLLENIDKISNIAIKKNTYKYHKVRKGETLAIIAARYQTSISSIMKANNIKKNKAVVNRYLKIPQEEDRIAYQKVYTSSLGKTQKGNTPFSYRVKNGDSLWNIARRYGTTAKKIKDINKLSTMELYIGQILKVSPAKS